MLSLPTVFWALGIDPALVWILHVFAALLVMRLLYVIARHPGALASDAIWVGGFAGATGSVVTQLLLHISWSASLPAAFQMYGVLGAQMYRWDMLSPWWPYAMIAWSALVYSALGGAMAFGARLRHRLPFA